MSDKTFKERVTERADTARAIYADFASVFTKNDGEQHWLDVFNVNFPDGEVDNLIYHTNHAFNEPGRNDAIIQTVLELGLHELLLGPLVYDERIEHALTMGQLTECELTLPNSEHPQRRFVRHNVSCEDPVFWRTLLEILCRAFVAKKGPQAWTLEKTIDLAFDLDEIRRKLLKGATWNEEDVRNILKKREPYKSKYPGTTHQAGVGENRLQEIAKDIGPMDDNALDRLKGKFPESFAKIQHQRELLEALSKRRSSNSVKRDRGGP
jgi:hypothetical protein